MIRISKLMSLAGVAACALAFVLASHTPVLATVKPIGGTPVGLERDPGNSIVARGTTDANGQVSFPNQKPGTYTLVIGGDAADGDNAQHVERRPVFDRWGTCLKVSVFAGSSNNFAVQAPMCPSSAKQGLRVTFDLPTGGDVRVALRTWISGVGDDANPVKNDTWASGNAAMGDVSTTRMKTAPDDANPGKDVTWASGNAAMSDVSTTRMKTAPDSGNVTAQDAPISASHANIKNGVRVAAADVNGDGQPDLAGAKDGANPQNKDSVFDGDTWDLNGIPVAVHNGLGNTVGRKLTDAKGAVMFQQLPPGENAFIVKKNDLESAVAKLAKNKPATVLLRVTENGHAIASATAQLPLDAAEMRVPFKAKEGGKRGMRYGLQAVVHF